MVKLNRREKLAGLVAAAIGIIQSTFGILFTLICIVLYLGYIPKGGDPESFQAYLYAMLIIDDQLPTDGIPPRHIYHIFMWLYMLLYIFWIATSSYQTFAIQKRNDRILLTFKLWSIAAILISLLDLAFLCFFCIVGKGWVDEDESMWGFVKKLILLATRLFVIWILNVCLAVYLIVCYRKYHLRPTEEESRQVPASDARLLKSS